MLLVTYTREKKKHTHTLSLFFFFDYFQSHGLIPGYFISVPEPQTLRVAADPVRNNLLVCRHDGFTPADNGDHVVRAAQQKLRKTAAYQ